MLNCHISLYAQSVKVYNIQLYLDKMDMMHMMQVSNETFIASDQIIRVISIINFSLYFLII